MTHAKVETLLAAAEARSAAATPGPWTPTYEGASIVSFPPGVRVHDWGSAAECRTPADAAFIAHAREDIDTLCAALRQALAEADALRARIDEAAAACGGHRRTCSLCGDLCDSMAADPSQWPIPLCHSDAPGVARWHHIGCVSERLQFCEQHAAKAEAECNEWASLAKKREGFSALEVLLCEVRAERDAAIARAERATATADAWVERYDEMVATCMEQRARAERAEAALHEVRAAARAWRDHVRTGGRLDALLDAVLRAALATLGE